MEPGTIPAADPAKKLGRVSQFLGKLQLRKRVAGGIRQLAEQTAQSISKYASFPSLYRMQFCLHALVL